MISEQAIKDAVNFNEAEVRMHLIDPVLDSLGYKYGSPGVFIKLEGKLETPRLYHIGRPSQKDFPLGFPDYRCGLLEGRGSFVVEAKAGSVRITENEVAQAHSYAAHAEVGANYFVLFNGIEMRVYETLSGHEVQPLLTIPINEIATRFHELENIISPENLKRNCLVHYDKGLKLGFGLKSKEEIRSGEYKVDDWALRIYLNGVDSTESFKKNVPQLTKLYENMELLQKEFRLRIDSGHVSRDDDGRLKTQVSFDGATKSNFKAMRLMGINTLELASNDKFISSDIDSPTVFEGTRRFRVEQGQTMPQLLDVPAVVANGFSGEMFVRAFLHYDDYVRGTYVVFTSYDMQPTFGQKLNWELDLAGTLELRLN